MAGEGCWTCQRAWGPCPDFKPNARVSDCRTELPYYECKPTFWGTMPDTKVYQSCKNSVQPPPGVYGPVLQYCILGPRCLKVPGWKQSSDVASITDYMIWRGLTKLEIKTAKASYTVRWNYHEFESAPIYISVKEKGGRTWHGVDGVIPGRRGGNYLVQGDGVIDQADYDDAPKRSFDRRIVGSKENDEHGRFWTPKYIDAMADIRDAVDCNRNREIGLDCDEMRAIRTQGSVSK